MLFGINESVEDSIIRLLTEGDQTAKKLHSNLPHTTLQAVYKALKQLEEGNIVVKQGKKISLNREWASKVAESLSETRPFPFLAENESATYKFTRFAHCDQFWKHMTLSIRDNFQGYPTFFYETHDLWIYMEGREESQTNFFRNFTEKGVHAYIVFGSDTERDKEFKRNFQSEFFRIDIRDKRLFPIVSYITIAGDYVISTIIDEDSGKKIDKLFEENPKDFVEQINKVFKEETYIKIRVERKRQKAKELRKKLSQNFVIPKELVEQFDLY